MQALSTWINSLKILHSFLHSGSILDIKEQAVNDKNNIPAFPMLPDAACRYLLQFHGVRAEMSKMEHLLHILNMKGLSKWHFSKVENSIFYFHYSLN